MRVLFVTPHVPFPTDKGTSLRNFGLLSAIGRDCEIGLVSLSDRPEAGLPPELATLCSYSEIVAAPPARHLSRRIIDLLRDSRPDLALRLYNPELAKAVNRATSSGTWDLIQFEGLETAHQAIDAVARGTKVLYDAHNAEWQLQARAARSDARRGRFGRAIYSAIQSARLRQAEGAIAVESDGVIVVSKEDALSIRAAGSPRRLHIAPNGIDTDTVIERSGHGESSRFLFTGTMDYRPNVDGVRWFAHSIWPEIRRQDPRAVFDIVGRAPVPAVRELDRIPGIIVHGATATMTPFFDRARVVVVPLLVGGGARLKILEAFAHGVPVVSTRLGIEGIEAVDQVHYVAAETPRTFAIEAIRLSRDLEWAARFRSSARELVRTVYDWRRITPDILRFYHSCVAEQAICAS